MKNLKLGFILEGAILMALFVFSLMEFAFGHSILGFVWLFLAVLNAIFIYKSKDEDYDLKYEVKLKELENKMYNERKQIDLGYEYELLKFKQAFNTGCGLEEEIEDSIWYNEADLVGFGNYLLSKEREEFYRKNKSDIPLKDRLSKVHGSDLKNYFN